MSNVSELVTQLGEVSGASKELYKQYKELKEKEDELRLELTANLKETGLLTAKTPEYTASIACRQNINVVGEKEAIDWIKQNQPNEADHYIGLKATNFKSLAMSMLKETGEVVPGTELAETETLSIRANKKEKK